MPSAKPAVPSQPARPPTQAPAIYPAKNSTNGRIYNTAAAFRTGADALLTTTMSPSLAPMGFSAVKSTVCCAAPQPEHLWQSPEQALSRIRITWAVPSGNTLLTLTTCSIGSWRFRIGYIVPNGNIHFIRTDGTDHTVGIYFDLRVIHLIAHLSAQEIYND